MSTAASQCPNCQAPFHAGDVFCEQCGARLAEDEPPASEQDRVELDLAVAAAVSDRGRVHGRNEDSFFLEVSDGGVAAVICDGISSASAGNAAARDAAKTAGEVLAAAVADPDRDGTAAMTDAIQAAGGAVELVPWTTRTGRVDPSCTLVSALRRGDEVVIGWVGDSRAYWLDAEDTRQLTVDDSLPRRGSPAACSTPEQAAASPVLTRSRTGSDPTHPRARRASRR